jgi:phage recombination protein Bet
MDLTLLFELAEGKPPVPLLPIDRKGKRRSADGQKIFTLAEAAKTSCWSEQDLKSQWLATFADYIEPDDSPFAQYTPALDQKPAPKPDAKADEMLPVDAPASAPIVGPKTDPATSAFVAIRSNVLRAMIFADLSDEHYEAFIALCSLRGFNPYAGQVYPKLVHDDQKKKLVVKLIIGIEGFRLVADRAGQLAGRDAPVYTSDSDGQLESASVTVYKLIDGQRHPFVGVVDWREYYPGDAPDSFWDRMPKLMLAKCAEASALRAGWPQELGGLYTPEEMSQADRYRRKFDEGQQTEPKYFSPQPVSDPSAPANWFAFVDQLKELGIDDSEHRTEVIAYFRNKHAAIADAAPRQFWKKIIEGVKADPSRWGLQLA